MASAEASKAEAVAGVEARLAKADSELAAAQQTIRQLQQQVGVGAGHWRARATYGRAVQHSTPTPLLLQGPSGRWQVGAWRNVL